LAFTTIFRLRLNYHFLVQICKAKAQLKALKDSGKTTAKQFLSDINTLEFQLFHLITAGDPHSQRFEDDFSDTAITVNYLRRIVAPQTCAINKQELLHLVKNDHVQKLHESVTEDRNTEALKLKDVRSLT
uniref:RPOL4c domain-containing protein n=1 Tax=Angiostrongylus cantonensis TaxID=6313 RepID=A0A0K0DK02_ANGCA